MLNVFNIVYININYKMILEVTMSKLSFSMSVYNY